MCSRALAIAAVSMLACSGGPRRVGGQPSWRAAQGGPDAGTPIKPASLEPIELVPQAPGARAYNDPPRTVAPSTPLGDAVLAELALLAPAAARPIPPGDGRLFAAAAEIATVVPSEGVVPYPLVEFALQHHGIIEPSPHLLVVWGPADAPSLIVEQLRPKLAEALAADAVARIGVGTASRPDGDVVVVALQASYLETQPIPRRLDGNVPLVGRILGAYRDPEVFVTRDNGSVERLALRVGDGGAISTELGCGGRRGRQQVEVTASDTTGSTVLANFPVWCGEDPPARLAASIPRADVEPVTTAADAEARMLELVNLDRIAAGLPPLANDPRVADVARAHSREMRITGVVGHVSATTGSAADRVKVGGIRTGLVLENIARAYGIGEAEAGLMNSPGHRANLLSPSATHIGIGIELGDQVADRRELFVTQVFIRVPPQVDPVLARDRIRAQLRAARTFRDSDDLDRIAQTYAAGLARGEPNPDAARRASRDLDTVAKNFQRVASMVTALADVEGVDPSAFLSGTTFTHLGIGVAQGEHEDLGPGALHVVVLLGYAR